MTWPWSVSTSETLLGSLILFNLVGLVFLIVSNLIKTYQDVMFHKRKVWIEKNISFLENQLSVLYGPVYSLLKANHELISEFKGSESRVRDRQREIIKNAIIPNNMKIVSIIQSNFHLLESPTIPSSFLKFTAHAEWQRATGMESGTVPSGVFPFPEAFANEVYETTEKLKLSLSDRRRRLR
jgi:hypothetical protein